MVWRNWVLCVLLPVSLLVGSCWGDDQRSSGKIVLVDEILGYPDGKGLDGRGDLVAGGYSGQYLLILKQDPVNPDLHLNRGSIDLGVDHYVNSLNVSDEYITVIQNAYNNGYLHLISLSSDPIYQLDLSFTSIGADISKAAARENWVLMTSGTELVLYDITDPNSPAIADTVTSSSDVTGIVAFTNGFYAFNNTGYLYFDCTNPADIQQVEVVNEDLQQVEKANVFGSKLYVGGSSKYIGHAKIARIDISDPGNPITELINETVNGTYVNFAYDQGSDSYFVVGDSTMYQYDEGGGVLKLTNFESMPHGEAYMAREWHVHNGRIYAFPLYGNFEVYKFR